MTFTGWNPADFSNITSDLEVIEQYADEAAPVEPTKLTITTTSLPNGTVRTPYSATLAAGGDTEPYTWSANDYPRGSV